MTLERGSFSFTTFYARRVRRIFPALAVVLAATLVAGWTLLLPGDYTRLARHVVAAAFFGANFQLQHEAGYFGPEPERNRCSICGHSASRSNSTSPGRRSF